MYNISRYFNWRYKTMMELREVNYKLARTKLDKFEEEYLVICGDYTYYWTDDYDLADMFTSVELLIDVIDKQSITIDKNNYKYYIVEDIETQNLYDII